MRALLLVCLCLVSAGCTQLIGAKQDPPPATTPEGVQPAQAPTPAAQPSSSSSPTPASSSNSSSPAPSQSAPPPVTPTPPPAPAPWALTAKAKLGWAQSLPSPGDPVPDPSSEDAAHCAHANATLPADAAKLVLAFSGQAGGTDGAGTYTLHVQPPNGTAFDLVPAATSAKPGEPIVVTKTVTTPASGLWGFVAEANGAAAGNLWTLQLDASGEGASAPTTLGLATTCK